MNERFIGLGVHVAHVTVSRLLGEQKYSLRAKLNLVGSSNLDSQNPGGSL